jgi:uncharacterized protein
MFPRFYNWLRHTELYFSLFKRRVPNFNIEGACKMTGNCCRNLILVDRGRPVRTRKRFDSLVRRQPYHEMFVPREEPDIDGRLRFSCRNLTNDHRCGIYDTRPDICRSYPEPRMIELGGDLLPGCGFTVVPEKDFEQFLEEQLVQLGKDKK